MRRDSACLQQRTDVAQIAGQHDVRWSDQQRYVRVDDVGRASPREQFADSLAVIPAQCFGSHTRQYSVPVPPRTRPSYIYFSSPLAWSPLPEDQPTSDRRHVRKRRLAPRTRPFRTWPPWFGSRADDSGAWVVGQAQAQPVWRGHWGKRSVITAERDTCPAMSLMAGRRSAGPWLQVNSGSSCSLTAVVPGPLASAGAL